MADKRPWYRGYKVALPVLLAWLLANLISTGQSVFSGWWPARKYVEAQLLVTSIQFKEDTPTHRVYAIECKINNAGSQSLTVHSAKPFVKNKLYPERPDKVLLPYGTSEAIKSTHVEAGKFQEFEVLAYVANDFVKQGQADQHTFRFPRGQVPAVAIQIQVQVWVFGGDGKFRTATSPPLHLTYADGDVREFRPEPVPVAFVETDRPPHEVVPLTVRKQASPASAP